MVITSLYGNSSFKAEEIAAVWFKQLIDENGNAVIKDGEMLVDKTKIIITLSCGFQCQMCLLNEEEGMRMMNILVEAMNK